MSFPKLCFLKLFQLAKLPEKPERRFTHQIRFTEQKLHKMLEIREMLVEKRLAKLKLLVSHQIRKRLK
jgi:hypothetical protein